MKEHRNPSYDELFELHVIISLTVTPEILNLSQAATRQNSCLLTIDTIVLQSWPETRKGCFLFVKSYWEFKDEIAYDNQLRFKSNRVSVPETLRIEIAKKIHESHQRNGKKQT